MPVGVARREIHFVERASLAKDCVNKARRFRKRRASPNAEVNRMLVMMLRTVTLVAACS